MNLHDLKAAYLARHRMSLDDSAIQHVHGFVAFMEAALAALDSSPIEVPAEEPAQAEAPAATEAQAQPEAPAADPAPEAQAQEVATAEAAAEAAPPSDAPAA